MPEAARVKGRPFQVAVITVFDVTSPTHRTSREPAVAVTEGMDRPETEVIAPDALPRLTRRMLGPVGAADELEELPKEPPGQQVVA